jgi:hypothetical protein
VYAVVGSRPRQATVVVVDAVVSAPENGVQDTAVLREHVRELT